MSSAQRPDPGEHNPYYGRYITLVPDGDIIETLAHQHERSQALLRGLSEANASWRPAPKEWSVKQVVGHLIDAERVFALRALWFARDTQDLPGFDQSIWMDRCRFDALPFADLLAEWAHCRASNLYLFRSFDGETWLRGGVASGSPSTVRTWVWGIAGHELHHIESLQTVYREALG
jgi:DinB superfamily